MKPEFIKYPWSLSGSERAAAKAIRAQLRGETGQERAEARALALDPGPGDELPQNHGRRARAKKKRTATA